MGTNKAGSAGHKNFQRTGPPDNKIAYVRPVMDSIQVPGSERFSGCSQAFPCIRHPASLSSSCYRLPLPGCADGPLPGEAYGGRRVLAAYRAAFSSILHCQTFCRSEGNEPGLLGETRLFPLFASMIC